MSNPQPNPEMRGTFKACYRGTIEFPKIRGTFGAGPYNED